MRKRWICLRDLAGHTEVLLSFWEKRERGRNETSTITESVFNLLVDHNISLFASLVDVLLSITTTSELIECPSLIIVEEEISPYLSELCFDCSRIVCHTRFPRIDSNPLFACDWSDFYSFRLCKFNMWYTVRGWQVLREAFVQFILIVFNHFTFVGKKFVLFTARVLFSLELTTHIWITWNK